MSAWSIPSDHWDKEAEEKWHLLIKLVCVVQVVEQYW